jgi:hypothetical protein
MEACHGPQSRALSLQWTHDRAALGVLMAPPVFPGFVVLNSPLRFRLPTQILVALFLVASCVAAPSGGSSSIAGSHRASIGNLVVVRIDSHSTNPPEEALPPSPTNIAQPNTGLGTGMPRPSECSAHIDVRASGSDLTGSFPDLATFPVTFTETGLPPRTQWSVLLLGVQNVSSNASIGFDEPDGSYPYLVGQPAGMYSTTDGAGWVNVTGTAVVVSIHFAPYYWVWFNETGLPEGSNWSVTLNGSTTTSSQSWQSFGLQNGTYGFVVPGANDWHPTPSSGNVTVTGHAVSIGVKWTPIPRFLVAFEASGLPGGTVWSVNLSGSLMNSTSSIIAFTEPNGTYPWSVKSIANYSDNPSTGSVSVNGANTTISVTFDRIAPLTLRAWGNITRSGGGGQYCVGNSGQSDSWPAWTIVNFSARASNGLPPYAFTWTFATGSPSATGSQLTRNFSGYGPWLVNVSVRDAAGANSTTQVSVTYPVVPEPIIVCPPPLLGLPPTAEYAILGGIAVGILVAVVVALIRFRTRHGPPRSPVVPSG